MNETWKQEIQNWILSQKSGMLSDLMELVNIPSLSDSGTADPPFGRECSRALEWMLEKGRNMGLTGTSYDGFAGSLSLGGEERQNPEQVTGIWCHLDVVPAGEGWQTPPFEAVYRDGLVTGRGAQDNKSAAIMGLYLLKGLKELNITLKHPAALYFGLNEEQGMRDADYFAEHFTPPGLSLIADCAFPACYGEKGILSVSFSTKRLPGVRVRELHGGTAHNIIPGFASAVLETGGGTYSLKAEGIGGHTAFPAGSKNAIPALLEQILRLPGLSQEEYEALDAVYRIAACADGAAAGIAVEDDCYGSLTCCAAMLEWERDIWKITMDIRYPHGTDWKHLTRLLKEYGERTGMELQVHSHLPSFGLTPEHPVVKKLTEVYNREMRTDCAPYAMAGATYAAKLPNAIPFGIAFSDKSAIYEKFPKGHGDYHQPDESVIFDQILRALAIYITALTEIDER